MLRHQDQQAAAQRHILVAVTKVEDTGLKTGAQASAYAQMLCTTSYTALGDAGAAIEAGRGLRAAQFKTAEHKGRMHTSLGRAWWQRGKPEQTAAELLSALRASPGEVRDRPAIRRIVSDLRSRHSQVVGVRELVTAVGSSA